MFLPYDGPLIYNELIMYVNNNINILYDKFYAAG